MPIEHTDTHAEACGYSPRSSLMSSYNVTAVVVARCARVFREAGAPETGKNCLLREGSIFGSRYLEGMKKEGFGAIRYQSPEHDPVARPTGERRHRPAGPKSRPLDSQVDRRIYSALQGNRGSTPCKETPFRDIGSVDAATPSRTAPTATRIGASTTRIGASTTRIGATTTRIATGTRRIAASTTRFAVTATLIATSPARFAAIAVRAGEPQCASL